MFEIMNIRQKPELLQAAVQYFWKQWGTETSYHFYRDCMERSVDTNSDVPRFYVMLDGDRIIGGYALLRSDLNSRQDLFPWFACLHVVPEYRGKNLGGQLQKHAVNQVKLKGYDKLYLCTDLQGYYEKNDWTYIGKGYLLDDEETRIYELQI
ncbi:GNAT family N-acetyltransferase [Paenibacillus sp. ACRRY]|uniref:GNAT family N-acetyltransferase n=1 Tax=Paenibacillus sp. ACRRY TaxID=2918208 RepID=UPI001EF520B3|nr:GNAT family N-acetyltransferase [Paenibacillus sp. ACRRY]MCG7386830.1 GNAT family N-acetyltransferase [Paenibacillus sp. ACRRY]